MKKIKFLIIAVLIGQIFNGCNSNNNENKQSMTLSNSHFNVLITIGTAIGVRQGKTVKFYEVKQGNWTPATDVSDFSIPNEADELITIGVAIGVRQGKTVKFYEVKQGNWTPATDVSDFNYSN